jgi:hypothetical protein
MIFRGQGKLQKRNAKLHFEIGRVNDPFVSDIFSIFSAINGHVNC